MALNPDRFAATAGTISQEEIDAGLRSYMLRVYNYMALGVALTGGIVLAVASSQALFSFVLNAHIFLFFGILGMGFFTHRIISMRSVATAHAFFWAYCAMWGLLIAPMVALYLSQDPTMVARAFFITTGMFAGVSLFGYTTKKNLGAFATFFMMASIGLVIAIVVNAFFVQSTMFSLITSFAVVLLFAGITAWETQMIKNMYMENLGDSQITKFALFGATILYGSFITLFIHILNILAILRGE